MSEILEYPEAASYLKMSVPTLKRRTADGTVPHVRIGARVIFPKGQLDLWLAETAANSVRPRPTPTVDLPRRRRRVVQPVSAVGSTPVLGGQP